MAILNLLFSSFLLGLVGLDFLLELFALAAELLHLLLVDALFFGRQCLVLGSRLIIELLPARRDGLF